MITARALGVYVYLKASGAHISSENLSSIFPEGRKAMLTALRELREVGLIATSRQLVNGKFVTQSYLSGSPEKELLLQQNMLNSNKSLIAYSFNSKIMIKIRHNSTANALLRRVSISTLTSVLLASRQWRGERM